MHLLSNMVAIIKVGYNAKHLQVVVQNSKICANVLNILYRLGYIRGYIIKDKKNIIVLLKYINNKPVIRNIGVVSTPGRRMYLKCCKLHNILKKKIRDFLFYPQARGC